MPPTSWYLAAVARKGAAHGCVRGIQSGHGVQLLTGRGKPIGQEIVPDLDPIVSTAQVAQALQIIQALAQLGRAVAGHWQQKRLIGQRLTMHGQHRAAVSLSKLQEIVFEEAGQDRLDAQVIVL